MEQIPAVAAAVATSQMTYSADAANWPDSGDERPSGRKSRKQEKQSSRVSNKAEMPDHGDGETYVTTICQQPSATCARPEDAVKAHKEQGQGTAY